MRLKRNGPRRTALADTNATRCGATGVLAAVVFAILAAVPAHAAIYKFVDAQGVVHYTDQKPGGRQNYDVIYLDPDRHDAVDYATVPLYLTAYTQSIRRASRRFNVDAALVRAIIHAESWFQRRAVSQHGAMGLMQLMPATASRFGVSNAFNAAQNIRAGVHYLSRLLEIFNGNVELATAAYNAGPGAVKRYGGVPPFPETRTYVNRVRILRRRYAAAM